MDTFDAPPVPELGRFRYLTEDGTPFTAGSWRDGDDVVFPWLVHALHDVDAVDVLTAHAYAVTWHRVAADGLLDTLDAGVVGPGDLAEGSALADAAGRMLVAITWAVDLLVDAVVNARHAGVLDVGVSSGRFEAHLLHTLADASNAQQQLRMLLGAGL